MIRPHLITKKNVSGIAIDSRSIKTDQLFIPIIGERFNGHDYIEEAYEKGIAITLTEDEAKVPKRYPAILVEDTKNALVTLAKYYRKTFDIDCIGITGSVGKTSCKEMIYSVLNTKYNTHKTKGNYNNDIGLPLTLLEMDQQTEIAIIEMGMNHFNEIDLLSSIALPNYAVITNIGLSHIENLGSKEGILKAKSEIINHLSKDGYILLNGDDEYLRELENQVTQKVLFFGFEANNDYYVKAYKDLGFDGIEAVIQTPNDCYTISVHALGKHILYHVLVGIIMGEQKGLTKEAIKKGIGAYKNEKMRLDVIKANNDITIINDSYNASVDSMKAAIDVLDDSNNSGRKVAILGDIFEMGDYAKSGHELIGDYMIGKSIDVLICVGDFSKWIYEKAKNHFKGKIYYYCKKEELLKDIPTIINKKDIVLVKASRGMKLEDTIEKIKEVS